MPIRRELKVLYPRNWRELSRRIRFVRARGACERCGRPHGRVVRCLPDGRWFDATLGLWRDGKGRPTRGPDLVQLTRLKITRVVLAAAHLDHNPKNNRLRNLKGLCQRCHLRHDRAHHLAESRVTYLLRRALGDLFLGPYRAFLADLDNAEPIGKNDLAYRPDRSGRRTCGRSAPSKRKANSVSCSTG